MTRGEGRAFVAVGLAMRGSQDFGEGLAWLSVVLGIIVILFVEEPPVIGPAESRDDNQKTYTKFG